MLSLSDLNNELRPIISCKMKVLPIYFSALFSSLLLALEGKFPVISRKRALSTLIASLVLLIVVAIGALIIYLIVVAPGNVNTTTVYP